MLSLTKKVVQARNPAQARVSLARLVLANAVAPLGADDVAQVDDLLRRSSIDRENLPRLESLASGTVTKDVTEPGIIELTRATREHAKLAEARTEAGSAVLVFERETTDQAVEMLRTRFKYHAASDNYQRAAGDLYRSRAHQLQDLKARAMKADEAWRPVHKRYVLLKRRVAEFDNLCGAAAGTARAIAIALIGAGDAVSPARPARGSRSRTAAAATEATHAQ